jgi:DNA-binding NtrC family response regulator
MKRKITMLKIAVIDLAYTSASEERGVADSQCSSSCHISDDQNNHNTLPKRRILDSLEKLNCEVEYVGKNIFYDSHPNSISRISLFLLAADVSNSDRFRLSLSNYVKNNPTSINVCLLPFGIDISNLDIIKYFDDFLYWPCGINELHARLYKCSLSTLSHSKNNTARDIDGLISTFTKLNLWGCSEPFICTLEMIKKIAAHQATVLIQGETGTGKENAARAIHYLGSRSQCAFVPINCATIPDDLLESELFGHEKGAFTDARQTKEGLVAVANGGTLFLDEVDSLSHKAQAALLRFLQTQEYRPVGSKQIYHANVRIIAATNADLKLLAQTKCFREDLFFRLNVLNLLMPPLRERTGDIPIIAESLVKRFSNDYDLPVKLLSQRSLRFLEMQEWPGNIREFENTLLRSFLMSNGKYLEVGDGVDFDKDEEVIAPSTNQSLSQNEIAYENEEKLPLCFQDAKAIAIESFEKDYLSCVMKISRGNVTAAAKLAGKERRALGKLLQKYDIDKYVFRP